MVNTRPIVIRDARFREHVAPAGHPERPERLDGIDRALRALSGCFREHKPRAASDEEILRVHGDDHLARLSELEGRAAQLDPDTYMSRRSLEIARLAAGSTIDLALAVANGEAPSAFALIRPPGHHAERSQAMGFCLINHVALAVQALRAAGLGRLAIVDWDVHHGNGTQHIFEAERDVLFLSLHQFPFYPGTGAIHERGQGEGEGSTLNIPLSAGCDDAIYGAAFQQIVAPVLLEFAPQMILVSAGFDAHARDPLASMQLSSRAYGEFTRVLRAVAEDCCGGRLLFALEGGYDLDALGESVAQVLDSLAQTECPEARFPDLAVGGQAGLNQLRAAHAPDWLALRNTPTG